MFVYFVYWERVIGVYHAMPEEMRGDERTLFWKLVVSFHHMEFGDPTPIVSFGSKPL